MEDKLTKLIKFLNVCPKCISGHIQTSKQKQDASIAIGSVVDTWSENIKYFCSNERCNYEVLVPNENYQKQTTKSSLAPSPLKFHGFDLFE